MKSFKIILFTLLFSNSNAFGQDTTFFDKDWKKIDAKVAAAYFRIVKKEGEKWKVNDYYISGKMQMSGYFRSLKDEKREGLFNYFRENGKPEKTMFYKNDSTRFIQKWNDAGNPTLVNGSGEYRCTNPNGNAEFEMFKDSVLSYAYFIDKTSNDTIYRVATTIATPKNGFEGFYRYIANNLVYPVQARENDIQGKVYIGFVVKADGSVDNFKIHKGIGFGCEEEVIRLLQNYKDWQPATVNHKKVNQMLNIPVVFKLND